jgi:hypothetical protein
MRREFINLLGGARAAGGQTADHRVPGCERYGLEFTDRCFCGAIA